MRWKTLAAAAMLAAFAITPLTAFAQDTGSTDQVQIFTTMPQPEQGYGTTLYRVIPASDQPAFISWLGGFQPEQQVLVIRTLHAYSLGGPNVTMFTTDTTPDAAMPVFVNLLTPADQPNFRTFWTAMTPEQQTAFVTYARDVATSQTSGSQTGQGTMFGNIQEPEHGYAMTIYNTIPASEQSDFMNWLNGFTPDQQLLVIRTLHNYSIASPDVANFTTDTTPDTAMPVFVKVVGTEDQTPFTTFWGTLTPTQQTSFVSYARYVAPHSDMGAAVNAGNAGNPANPGDMGNQPSPTYTTTGSAGQPMSTIALSMATVFAPFLPEADRTTYTTLAGSTPPAELGGMNHFLSTLTPDQAGMVVRMVGKLNEMGMSGTHMANGKGISDYDAKKLLSSQLDSGDMTSFESMYNGMDDQQRTTLLQLARDAYNGGLNDLGATMSSSGS